MTPERWERVRERFEAAVELAPAERSAFLQEECAPDTALRVEVERLLRDRGLRGGLAYLPSF